jgi:hypothetical protein
MTLKIVSEIVAVGEAYTRLMRTRRSHSQSLALLAATSAAVAMVETRAALADCTMDVECEGERICEHGLCVDPGPEAVIEGPSAAASAGDATTPATPAAAAPPAAVSPAAFLPSVTAPPSPASAVTEVGGFGFKIYDENAATFGGGVEAGYRLLGWLAIGAWLEGTGEREQAIENGSVTYRRYDLGVGPTVGKEVAQLFGDLSVLPKLTRLTLQGTHVVRGFVTENPVTRWGIAADARLRLGLVLGPWRLFMFVAGSYASQAESLTLYHYPDRGVTVGRGNVSLGVGLSYCFGTNAEGDTITTEP